VLGVPELTDDARFSEMSARSRNRVELDALVNSRTSQFTRADLLTNLDAVGVPAGPINTISEVLNNPQVIHRGMRIELDNPLAKTGSTPGLRSAIKIDGTPMASARHAPALGEHTHDVLADPNWSEGGWAPS
jgi:crotonobetainyl-CoA:carnitine CoA-transferase CaiB-like acyl-CoA transferase